MIAQDAHLIAAAGVAAIFIYLGLFGVTVRAARIRGLSLGLGTALGLAVGPIAAPVLSVLAIQKPELAIRARGGGFFRPGPDGALSASGLALGLLVALGSVVATFAYFRFSADLRGEQLQGPVVKALLLGGLAGGFAMATRAKRVAFLEAIWVTGLGGLLPVVAGPFAADLFTYGTAAAYYAVVLAAGTLILLLALTLGGSLGYLFTGDGDFTFKWNYEQWIGRRFLMGKGGHNVVGIITVISVLAVAVGTCAMIVVMSVMNGFSTDLRSKIFGANAHLIVLKYGTDFTEYDDISARTRKIQGITGASPFVLNEVMVSSDVNLTGALLKGIDIATIDEVSVLRSNIVKGSLEHLEDAAAIPVNKPAGEKGAKGTTLGKSEGEILDAAIAAAAADTPAATVTGEAKPLPGIVIGQEMSRNLKVYVGDVVNVVSPVGELGPSGPVPKARAFRVAGVFFSGMYEYDSKFIYIDLEEAQDFFTLKGAVTGIEYKVDDIENTRAISRDILDEVGGYPFRTKDWMEMNRNLFSALKMEKIAMFIILTFIILVASFLIAATLIVFVIEKSKEIAILKSMGATDTSIMKVFVTYGVTVGTVGALCGLVVGLLICTGIETFGIGLDPDVYYITDLPVHIDGFEVGLVAMAAICLSYLATIYPSLIAARMRPVEGLRFE